MTPYIGMPVLYHLRPGQVRAGQSELAAVITRVNSPRPMKIEQVQTFKRAETIKERDAEAGELRERIKVHDEQRLVEGSAMSAESVDLTIFLPDAEPLRYQNVMAKSEAVTGHCWAPTPLALDIEILRADMERAVREITGLTELVNVLGNKVPKAKAPALV